MTQPTFDEDSTFNPDYTLGNSIEEDITPEQKPDPHMQRFIAMRKEQVKRLIENTPAQKTDIHYDKPDYLPDNNHNADLRTAIPDIIYQRFTQVKNKFYFPDKTLAFQDRGTKLTTPHENKIVVQSLIAIAKARGWNNLKITGTEEFRKTAWLEASLQGMEVRGYKPTDLEKAHLVTLIEKATIPELASQKDITHKTHDLTTSKGLSGKLLAHGAAPYEHDANNEASYFITLETNQCERTLWGIDFGRAIAESEVSNGDNITVEYQGKKTVTATVKERDNKGKIVSERQITTHRNSWLIEKAQSFKSNDKHEVVKQYPDLAPAYGTLTAAQKFAEKHWPDNETQQARFLDKTKDVLASKIEHGEKIPSPKLRKEQSLKIHHEKLSPEKDQREHER